MRVKLISQEPFKLIINREWQRAKDILPQLKRKPKFLWKNSTELKGAYGICHYRRNIISVHCGFLELADHKEFVLLLRHEFAHLLRPAEGGSHGQDFKWWNNRLGGSRYVSSTLTELRKKTTPSEIV